MAGGVRVPVTLRPPDFRPDLDELTKAITPRTRLILLNSPHNPTGTVFTRDELAAIAALAVEHDLLVVTDEVYEHLVFDGEHVPIAQFPGMRERTVSVSSAGKTFSFTGWKIGWVKAAPELVTAVKTAKQFLTFVSGGPFQYAVAEALALPDEYYAGLRDDLRAQRDLLCAGLTEIGFEVYPPQGTYFVTADIRPLGYQDGVEFCRTLPRPRRRGRHPHRDLLRPPRSGPQPRPLRLLQAPRGADRGPEPAVPAHRIGGSGPPPGGSQPHGGVPARPPGWDHGLREEPAAMDFAYRGDGAAARMHRVRPGAGDEEGEPASGWPAGAHPGARLGPGCCCPPR